MRTTPLLLLVALLAACRTSPVPEVNPYASRADAAHAGAKLYRQHCAQCHGADAGGHGSAPSLRAAVDYRSDRDLFMIMTNGDLKGGMPSWSQLPEQRRWQLVAYLRSLH